MTVASTAPEPAAKGRLDAGAVAVAALAVAERGSLISATAVQRELGRGSMVTVAKHLKEWATTAMPLLAGKVTAPKWTAREMDAMATLRRIFREEATAALNEQRAEAQAAVAGAEETVRGANETAQVAHQARLRAEERASGLEASLAALTEQLAALNRSLEEKDAQIERMQAGQAEDRRQYERTVADLRKATDLAEERYRAVERHRLVQIDEAKQAFVATETRLREDLTMAHTRYQRANTDLDRVRNERDATERRAATAEAKLAESQTARTALETRLAAATEQVGDLVARTGALAGTQSTLATQLSAAQRETTAVRKTNQQLARAARNLIEVLPSAAELPGKAVQTRLGKAAVAVRALLPAAD